MHVLHEIEASFVSCPRGTSLESVVTFEEILHIDNMYPVIISRISNEYDVLSKVLECVGRLHPSCKLNPAREVLLAQKTQNAIGKAFVITCSHNRPTLAQVIKKKY
jgi:hypothetical protein